MAVDSVCAKPEARIDMGALLSPSASSSSTTLPPRATAASCSRCSACTCASRLEHLRCATVSDELLPRVDDDAAAGAGLHARTEHVQRAHRARYLAKAGKARAPFLGGGGKKGKLHADAYLLVSASGPSARHALCVDIALRCDGSMRLPTLTRRIVCAMNCKYRVSQ